MPPQSIYLEEVVIWGNGEVLREFIHVDDFADALLFFLNKKIKEPFINIGPGKVALLEAIISQGSISSAAKYIGMSYRKAWNLVAEINNAAHKKIILTNTGGKGVGGTKISSEGI